MDFQKEYNILKNASNDQILQIKFHFNDATIKWCFTNTTEHAFLVLICETDSYSFVKSYPIYPNNSSPININQYFGNYHKYAKILENKSSFGFNDFYKKLQEAICSLEEDIINEEFEISFIPLEAGLDTIHETHKKSAFKGDPIYFHYIRRRPISPKQFRKITKLFGKDVAQSLRERGITAVLTPDIALQRTLILLD